MAPPSLLKVAGLGPRQGPMSVEEITSEAEDMLRAYNPNIALKMFLRSADAINKQGLSYDADGNEEEAFKFYYRHALLIMNKLSKHPEVVALNKIFKDKSVRPTLDQQQSMSAWRRAKKDVTMNLERMETLKPNIKRRYEAYQMVLARREEEERQALQSERNNAYNALVGGMGRLSVASSRSGLSYARTQELDPDTSSELAVKLAHNEFRGAGLRSPSKLSSYRQSRISHRGTFFSDDDSEDDLVQQIIAVAQRREQAMTRPDLKQHRTSSAKVAPQYPSVPKKSLTNDSSWYGNSPDSTPSLSKVRPELEAPAPMKPSKEHFLGSTTPPPIPSKVRTPSPIEAPDTGALDPRKYTFLTSASTEDGKPLRTLFINPKLRSRFLTIALANTQHNLETCGILCGKLMSNAFFVTKLVIPEQESTSDTCDTVNEGALFDYCDSENLMTLGWIHTHPTQTCFMSSRDLHTHSGYQVQLAESIAIVCAPRHEPSWGVFRLTDPPGLGAVLNCKQTGLFHPHKESNIYTDALLPGHVKELENLPFDVVDLRPDSTWI